MKKMITYSLIIVAGWFWTACNSGTTPKYGGAYDAQTGMGPFTGVTLPTHFTEEQVANGEKIFQQKCNSCHNLTEARLIGPGLKGITQRHQPTWILNYLTNTDDMLDQDSELQNFIKSGMPRMPDQGLSKDDALAILAFLEKNDLK